jgi:outer membrane protein TolC
MKTNHLRVAVLAAALWPPLLSAAPLTLDEALTLAVQRSESRRAADAATGSAREAAKAASELPDPMLQVGIENLPVTDADRFSTTREGMTMKRVGISQEWLSRDKRHARQSVAEAMVRKEAVAARSAIAEVRLRAAIAYVDAFYAGRMRELTALNERHAREELVAARGRLASATGSSQEVLALEAARGLAEDANAEARQQQAAAGVILTRWTGVDAPELAESPNLAVPAEMDYVEAHPTVVAMQREVDLARNSATLTVENRKPNWTWQVAYGHRSGYSDMVSVGLSIPLPVAPGQRQDREIASKQALVDKAESDLLEARREAQGEYQALRSQADLLEERISRYRTAVVRPAEQRTAVATAAYRSGQSPLSTVFEARHAELDARRKVLALQSELAKTKARLVFTSITSEVAP